MGQRGIAVTGSVAVPLFLGALQTSEVPQTIINTGPVTVYVDEATDVSPQTSIPLRTGSSVTWNAGTPAYAIADPGNVGAVTVSDAVTAMADAGGIAQQLIGQNLPGLIAAQIAQQGAPPIDAPQTVANWAGALPSAGVTMGPLVVGTFQSLSWQFAGTNNRVALAGASPFGLLQLSLAWYASAADAAGDTYFANAVLVETFEAWAWSTQYPANPASGVAITPVRAPYVVAVLLSPALGGWAGGQAKNASLKATGSLKGTPSSRHASRIPGFATPGNTTFPTGASGSTAGAGSDNAAGVTVTNLPLGSKTTIPLPTIAGPASMFLMATTGASGSTQTQFRAELQTGDGAVELYSTQQYALNASTQILLGSQLTLPAKTHQLVLTVGSGAAGVPMASVQFGLTQSGV